MRASHASMARPVVCRPTPCGGCAEPTTVGRRVGAALLCPSCEARLLERARTIAAARRPPAEDVRDAFRNDERRKR